MTKFKKGVNLVLTIMLVAIFNVIAFASIPYVHLDLTYDSVTHKYSAAKLYLNINEKELTDLPLEPVILNDYTLVPAREVFEELGATVNWYQDDNYRIEVIYEDTIVNMNINELTATKGSDDSNLSILTMDIPPKLINAKTMIPLRFVSESIGFEVVWNADTRVIDILSPTVIETTTEETTETTTEETTTEESTEETTETTTEESTEETTEGFVDILSLEMAKSNEKVFKINTASAINRYQIVRLDDKKIAVDIYDSINSIDDTIFNSVNSEVLSVEIVVFSDNMTRFIFNLLEPTVYHNYLSEDLKTFYIIFGENEVTNLETFSDSDNLLDVIKISTAYLPDFEIEYNENVLSVKLSNTGLSNMSETLNPTIFIDSLMYIPMEENESNSNISEIQFFLKLDVTYDYSIVEDESMIIINIASEDYTGFDDEDSTENENSNENPEEAPEEDAFIPEVSSHNQFIIAKNSDTPVNINNIVHQDDYLDGIYTLKFSSDLDNLLEEGIYNLTSDYANTLDVSNLTTGTQITINCKKITAVTVTEDENNIYINLMAPQEKYDNVVVIDAGHGGHDPGAVKNGINEKDVALDLILKLEKLLEPHTNIKAYFTRTTDVYPEFSERTGLSNEVADFFISIHYNSVDSSSVSGTETYYTGSNSNSSGLTSKILAEIVQQSMLDELGTMNRGVKTANYIVLRDTTKPAILAEVEFLSNPTQASKIKTEEFKINAANSIYNAIIKVTELYKNVR